MRITRGELVFLSVHLCVFPGPAHAGAGATPKPGLPHDVQDKPPHHRPGHVDDDNIYTFWRGQDKVRGRPPILGSHPADPNDSLLVNDPAMPRP